MEISLIEKNSFRIKTKSGILTITKNNSIIESVETGSRKEINEPGEYEVSGISVIGIQDIDRNIFVYEAEDLRICNIDMASKKIADGKLSQMGDADVLLLSVGEASVEILQQIEPYYCIPYGYENQEALDKFLKDCGLMVEKISKLQIKKDNIVEDQATEVKLLEIKG